MSKPKLALIPSGYKSGKVYSILPNDATGDFDFTRQSIGTRVRKDGLIEEMQTYGENELLNSDFNTTDNWVVNGATGTVIENGYARIFTSGAYTEIYQAGTSIVANELYRLDYEVISNDGGNLGVVAYSGVTQLLPSTVGKHSVEFLGNNTTLAIKRYSGATDIKIAYAKVYKINFNVPRLDWLNSNCPSLLLEPQRTNLFQRSEEFDSSYWTKARSSVTSNKITAPNGELTADQFFDSTDTNSHLVYKSISITNGVEYSFSCFMKKGTLSKGFLAFNSNDAQTVVFDLENGIVESQGVNIDSSKIENYGNDWYKCSFTHTSTATTFLYRVGTYNGGITYTGTGNDYIYIWGAQLEQASYTSSYIKTEASAVTRLEDDCHLLNQTLFTDYPFTVYAKAKVEAVGNFLFGFVDSANSSKYLSVWLQGVNQIYVLRRDALTSDSDAYSFNYSIGDDIKVAVSFINDTSYKFYINGTEIGNVTGGSSIPYDHNDIVLGQLRIASDNGLRNSIDDFRVYDYTLTDAELTELTTL